MRHLACDRGGECLSEEYINGKTKLRWRCKEGHEWLAIPSSVKNMGTWCSKCFYSEQRCTIEQMREIARSRGGECLSTTYTNNRTKIRWMCAHGHKWNAIPSHVKDQQTWCPACGGTEKLTIEEMQTLAHDRGGKCLSEEYTNSFTKLRWQCSQGHEWLAAPLNIKTQGTWCPHCLYKNEQECREAFEALTEKSFPKSKPEWLQGLELDGYCPELRIAFEYQGRQHYKVIPHWHSNGKADLEAQQARDAKKVRLCDENWVTLVVIPHTIRDKTMFIERELYMLLP